MVVGQRSSVKHMTPSGFIPVSEGMVCHLRGIYSLAPQFVLN
jgi:hypothetical protein